MYTLFIYLVINHKKASLGSLKSNGVNDDNDSDSLNIDFFIYVFFLIKLLGLFIFLSLLPLNHTYINMLFF